MEDGGRIGVLRNEHEEERLSVGIQARKYCDEV